jgi:hypothetical protein
MRMGDSPALLSPRLRESRALDMQLDHTRKCDECGSQFFPNVATTSLTLPTASLVLVDRARLGPGQCRRRP